MESTTWLLITIVITLIIGVFGGYWYGKKGKAIIEAELEKLKKEIKEKL